jgi:hypothetical protein
VSLVVIDTDVASTLLRRRASDALAQALAGHILAVTPLPQILSEAAAGEIPAVTDVDGAVAPLAGPLLLRRIVLDQPVGPVDADRSVEAFLAGAAP